MRVTFLSAFILGFTLLSRGDVSWAQDLFLPDIEQEKPLGREDVKSLFSGKTHIGSYNFEIQNFKGINFEELTKEDGTVIHKMGARVDTGRWSMKGHKICFEYDSPDLYGTCLSYYQRGNCIYHFLEAQTDIISSQFTAVSVVKGEVPRCDPPMS
ncbi:hypothetical protein DES40_0618 [Litorimonas taeanensis]|uniref:Uncharacterized protein n=1 Tax=Litorimonas taeanensis TaxID=568099 RepID=A0A420WK75_9PROT|nr:hypothetical protein [Litorimonas taeanensis]RKQ71305.1 hypothetical protein DES40_0618 [Litorimonas taeanensis]